MIQDVGAVHWDDPEGWYGEGGGGEVQDGKNVYTRGGFMLMYRLTSIESVMPSNHLILGHPLLLLPPIPPSIRVFSNESTLRMR